MPDLESRLVPFSRGRRLIIDIAKSNTIGFLPAKVQEEEAAISGVAKNYYTKLNVIVTFGWVGGTMLLGSAAVEIAEQIDNSYVRNALLWFGRLGQGHAGLGLAHNILRGSYTTITGKPAMAYYGTMAFVPAAYWTAKLFGLKEEQIKNSYTAVRRAAMSPFRKRYGAGDTSAPYNDSSPVLAEGRSEQKGV